MVRGAHPTVSGKPSDSPRFLTAIQKVVASLSRSVSLSLSDSNGMRRRLRLRYRRKKWLSQRAQRRKEEKKLCADATTAITLLVSTAGVGLPRLFYIKIPWRAWREKKNDSRKERKGFWVFFALPGAKIKDADRFPGRRLDCRCMAW